MPASSLRLVPLTREIAASHEWWDKKRLPRTFWSLDPQDEFRTDLTMDGTARFVWVVFLGGDPVAIIAADIYGDECAEVMLSVKPEWRGRRIGSHALLLAKNRAELAGRRLLAEVHPDNAASLRLVTNVGGTQLNDSDHGLLRFELWSGRPAL